jgi:hypothetical protein
MASFGESWPEAAHFIGLILEIVGVFFTAARYTKIPWDQIPRAFISALWQGPHAEAAAVVAEGLAKERPPQLLRILQGIAFIVLGLAIQLMGAFGSLHKPTEVPDSTGTTLFDRAMLSLLALEYIAFFAAPFVWLIFFRWCKKPIKRSDLSHPRRSSPG